MQIKEIQEDQWLGMPDHPVKPCKFRAGQITMEFLNGRILNVCAGGQKLIDEVYFALRDYNWGTVPYRMEGLCFEEKADRFRISFHAIHDSGDIQFEWEGVITGAPQSSIEYTFHGHADSDFLRNRIGFCVLHPADCGGMDCKVEHVSSASEKGTLPKLISPGQPFIDIKSITQYTEDGMALRVAFQGDVFEMEDQRNWTDASFKTYCTPLSIPFPVQVHKGDCVHQSVEIRLLREGKASPEAVPCREEAVISVGDWPVMKKGFSLGSCITRPLTGRQLRRAAALGLSHLRVDYHFCEPDETNLREMFIQAGILGARVMLAVFFTDQWESEVRSLESLLADREEQVLGMLIYQERVPVIPPETLKRIRYALSGKKIAVGSGTDAFFTQINRQRPARECMDFVCYSNNPQVHAFDNDSIMSTTQGQRMNIESCAALYPGLPVWVSPITLRMRWNPDATGRELLRKGEIPRDVDSRQMSLFAASWFLRSAASCIAGGAAAATCFELTGSKGMMEDAKPDRDYPFPSAPDMLFPLYFAFFGLRNLSAYRAGVVNSETVTAIFLEGSRDRRLILSNPRGESLQVKVEDGGSAVKGLCVDQENIAELAQRECFSADDMMWREVDLTEPVVLKPYAFLMAEF